MFLDIGLAGFLLVAISAAVFLYASYQKNRTSPQTGALKRVLIDPKDQAEYEQQLQRQQQETKIKQNLNLVAVAKSLFYSGALAVTVGFIGSIATSSLAV